MSSLTFTCSCCRCSKLPATCFAVFAGAQRLTCLTCKTNRAKNYAKRAANKPPTIKKSNPWVLHIKSFAAANNITYGAAMRLRTCSTAYLKAKWLTGYQATFLRELEAGETVIRESRRALTEDEWLQETGTNVPRLDRTLTPQSKSKRKSTPVATSARASIPVRLKRHELAHREVVLDVFTNIENNPLELDAHLLHCPKNR